MGEDTETEAEAPEAKLRLSDDDFLRMVRSERQRAIGLLAQDDNLAADRALALDYYNGSTSDVKALENRSSANSTDVSDGIETVMPDLMEVLAGGEDVLSFTAKNEADDKAAQQETEMVKNVVFEKNNGFMIIYSHVKDALLSKIGVTKHWYEEPEYEDEHHEGVSAQEVQIALQQGAIDEASVEADGYDEETGEPTSFSFSVRNLIREGRERIAAVPPEDFTVARDTVRVPDATYCAMISRPRAMKLIADGYDEDKVEDLPAFGGATGSTVEQARDTAGEHDASATDSSDPELRTVEIIEHYLRVDADGDGQPEIWCIVTGKDEGVLLKKERVSRIPFAVSTPFPITHRLFGRSLADLLMEIQRIKTVLLRMLLDSGYFAMNQRSEIAMDKANQWTIQDYLRNVPGMPIRSKTGDAVRAVSSGAMPFDVTGALEFMSTVAEQRSGVVRNAQGLNPDTLHKTAAGAAQLIGAAQKRIRMVARIFAETGLKDLYLGVHADLRKEPSTPLDGKVGGQWSRVDPTEWPEREDMAVEVGVGAGGRDHDLMMLREVLGLQAQAVQAQGGMSGPLVTPQNLYASAVKLAGRAGIKQPELFFSDPSKAEPQAPQPPPPDPAAIKAQADGQAQVVKAQADGEKAVVDAQTAAMREQNEAQRLQLELQRQAEADRQAEHDRQMAWAEYQQAQANTEADRATNSALKLAQINAEYDKSITVATIKADAEALRAHADMVIQASEHDHAHVIAEQQHAHAMEQQASAPEPALAAEESPE